MYALKDKGNWRKIQDESEVQQGEILLIGEPKTEFWDDVVIDFENGTAYVDENYISVPAVVLDYEGLYKELMDSAGYAWLVQTCSSVPNLAATLIVMTESLQYGIMRPADAKALSALQSSVNVLMSVSAVFGVPLSTLHKEELRGLLDNNGFTSITL